jgi:hypothetical protein
MELTRRKAYREVVLAGDLRDIGGMFADALRSGVDIAGRTMNTIATRGGADSVVTLDAVPQEDNTLWYALGAAGILAVAAVAMKRKKR